MLLFRSYHRVEHAFARWYRFWDWRPQHLQLLADALWFRADTLFCRWACEVQIQRRRRRAERGYSWLQMLFFIWRVVMRPERLRAAQRADARASTPIAAHFLLRMDNLLRA